LEHGALEFPAKRVVNVFEQAHLFAIGSFDQRAVGSAEHFELSLVVEDYGVSSSVKGVVQMSSGIDPDENRDGCENECFKHGIHFCY
jgi:hypothetical protein